VGSGTGRRPEQTTYVYMPSGEGIIRDERAIGMP
jgi:hypothetical protein